MMRRPPGQMGGGAGGRGTGPALWRRGGGIGSVHARRRLVAELLHRGGRCVHVGHSWQSGEPADLQDPVGRRSHQGTRDGLCQLAASAHRGRLCARRFEGQRARVQGLQDSSRRRAACHGSGDSKLYRAHGGDSRSSQGSWRRIRADARSGAAI